MNWKLFWATVLDSIGLIVMGLFTLGWWASMYALFVAN
jgi:cbb3-type cytochrome oxidase subunit 3